MERELKISGPSRPGNGLTRSWTKTISDVPYSFRAIIMPDGECRYVVYRFNGYIGGPAFACAWDQVHFITVPPKKYPACPTCDDDHEICGTCSVCGYLVYEDCEGDLLHADFSEVFARKNGDHTAELAA